MTAEGKLKTGKPRHLQQRSPQNTFQGSYLSHSSREAQRAKYIERARQSRDEHNWQKRSDQILRQEYVEQKRQWEIERAASAPQAQPEDVESMGDYHNVDEEDGSRVDEIISLEDDAFNALIAQAPQNESMIDEKDGSVLVESDDEDYQSLFADLLSNAIHDDMSRDRENSAQERPESQSMDIVE